MKRKKKVELKSGLVEDGEVSQRMNTIPVLRRFKARSRYRIVDGSQFTVEDSSPDNRPED